MGILALVALLYYALWWCPHAIEVTTQEFSIPNLPPELARLRILHLSDVHSMGLWPRERKLLRLVDQLAPDLILISGDYYGSRYAVSSFHRALEQLKAPLGVWGVLGNWEYWEKVDTSRVIRQVEKAGVRLLRNQSVDITVGGSKLCLVGVDDPYEGQPDLDKALVNRTVNPRSGATILLAHSPLIARYLPHPGIDLVLVGHTHGGQVRLPLFGAPYVPGRDHRRYLAGRFDVGGTPMYVSRGIGLSILPVRFLVRPEITVVSLVPRSG